MIRQYSNNVQNVITRPQEKRILNYIGENLIHGHSRYRSVAVGYIGM